MYVRNIPTACECNTPLGAQNDFCNKTSGQCQCRANYGERQCYECRNGFYYYPDCDACSCDTQGTVDEICNKDDGRCICKEGFNGSERCDRCQPGHFGHPTCDPCECSDVGDT